MHRFVRRLVLLPSIAIALVVPAIAPAGALAASDFPVGWRAFHTYPEMVADIHAVAAAHPDIVHLVSIGQSYQGRQLWAAKISDNVNVDENEPEVLFDGVHHSDEHMGLEMTLHILHWLADGYGKDARVTNIVNTREVWVIFEMNPDGATFDIRNGHFHFWRKNRQPTPGSSAIGTDLNRNYGYHWGLGGRTSRNPQAITYHGPKAFSAPETRAYRDFLASRVVGGRQQIRVAITFHEAGRLVMWPYGYTKKNVPPDMTIQDQAALRLIGRHMAKTNGYKPEQASDLYISDGTSRDYLYGTYRTFSYTFEMSNRDYPKSSFIAPETGRNREAVLWLAERAWCPLAVLGTAVRDARCGAFDDDLEVARGWQVNPDGTDTATTPAQGRWAQGNPAATQIGGITIQPTTVPSGRYALVTGLAAGSSAAADDLDGLTTIRSVPITLPAAAGQRLTFAWMFSHAANSSSADHLRAIVQAGATQTVVFERTGSSSLVAGSWHGASISMDPWAGQTVQIRFEALDGAGASTVEAGIDNVRVTRASPNPRLSPTRGQPKVPRPPKDRPSPMPSWIRDLLFESPIPPSNWMPVRSERIANARATLRRRFGQAQDVPRGAHRLRDLGGAYPLAGGTRYVSGSSIEADLEADITSVNPPIIQGWAYLAAIIAAWLFLLGLGTFRQDPIRGLLEMVGGPAVWLALQAGWGFGQRMIELEDDGVHVRRWTDVWLRRAGRCLGAPESVHATMHGPNTVELASTEASVQISLRSWSSTARADLVDEVPTWGVDCNFGRRRQSRLHH